MKKKILFGAVIAALALGFVSCKKIGDIQWKDKGTGTGTKTFTVEQKNETKSTIRGLAQFDLIKRAKATCVVQQFKQSKNTCDGMVGFITYYSENRNPGAENDGTMNFLVVGVRNNGGSTETYASYYGNIRKDELSTQNFGADKKLSAYSSTEMEPYEVVIVDLPGTPRTPGVNKVGNINNVTFDETGTLKLAIEFTGNTDGSIDIKWYKDWNTTPASQSAASIDFDGKSPVFYETAKAAQIGNVPDPDDPSSKVKKGYIYAYANILPGKTLNAKWELYNASMALGSYADEGEPEQFGDIFFEEF